MMQPSGAACIGWLFSYLIIFNRGLEIKNRVFPDTVDENYLACLFCFKDMEELYGESRQAAGFSEDVSGGQ